MNPWMPAARRRGRPVARRTIRLVFVCAGALLLLAWPVDGPRAHSWYPMACCQDHDCMRVDTAEHLADGSIMMHAGSIAVLVPKGFQQMPSQDNDMHVCVYRSVSGWKPRCVFMPAGV